MLRYVCAILFLTILGLAVVQLRGARNASEARMDRLELERLKVRRLLWAGQIELNGPTPPAPNGSGDPVWAMELAPPRAESRRLRLARNE